MRNLVWTITLGLLLVAPSAFAQDQNDIQTERGGTASRTAVTAGKTCGIAGKTFVTGVKTSQTDGRSVGRYPCARAISSTAVFTRDRLGLSDRI